MWDKIEQIQSSDKNVAKFVFTKGNAVAEAVLYKYPTYEERTVICCSTQSGCPVGCRFCGAGDYFVRSLTAEEIISQPEYLLKHKDCVTPEEEEGGELKTVFLDGKLLIDQTLAEIRARVLA